MKKKINCLPFSVNCLYNPLWLPVLSLIWADCYVFYKVALSYYFHGSSVLSVCIFHGMNHPKDGIFELQCYRYFQEIFSNTSRCLGCSASLLKASFMASLHSWVDCEARSEKSSKDIENLEWSREFLLFVFVRSRTGGLWFISCSDIFYMDFVSCSSPQRKQKHHHLVTHKYTCISIKE